MTTDVTARTPVAAPRGLVPALVYCGLCTSIVGSLGALLIPTVSAEYGVSRAAGQWVLTASLLVGAVATPLLGSLSDGPQRRRVLLGTLVAVLVGSVLAATATTFGQFLVGRALQGLTYGVIPMATASARALLPPDRVRAAVAALSVTTVTGAGLSFPLTGLIVEVWDPRWAFWFAAAFIAVALVAVVVTTPSRDPAEPGRVHVDVPGAVLLAGALSCLLVALSQGRSWGFASPAVVLLVVSAVVLGLAWTWVELRVDRPLVRLRSLRDPEVALADVAALGLGAMLFAGSSAVSQLVQTPASAGFGLSLSLLGAGLVLLPASVGSQVSNRLAQVLLRRMGAGRLLPAGPLLLGADMVFLAFCHDRLWQVLLGMFVQGLAIGVTFVVMPTMILGAVPAAETGSAVALNQVLRTIGGAIGSAATGALLAASLVPGTAIPDREGFQYTFLLAAAGCALLTVLLSATPRLITRRSRLLAVARTEP